MSYTSIQPDDLDRIIRAAVRVATQPSDNAYAKPYAFQHYVSRTALFELLSALRAPFVLHERELAEVVSRLHAYERQAKRGEA